MLRSDRVQAATTPVAVVVSLEERGRSPRTDLDGLVALTAEDMDAVNALHPGPDAEPGGADPAAGRPYHRGRRQAAAADADARVRAALRLSAARAIIALAACVEFIHTATLLHDDVVDESDLRRGSATANAVWGNKPSVLVGDFLFSRAFQLMVDDGSLARARHPVRAPRP